MGPYRLCRHSVITLGPPQALAIDALTRFANSHALFHFVKLELTLGSIA